MTVITTVAMHVDWDWTSGAPDFSQTNDDISAYYKGLDIITGITQADSNVASVGTVQITLQNTTRRFTPNYSAGPLYGKLLPGKPIRIQATAYGVTSTIFRGFTTNIVVKAGQYKSRECTLEAQDYLGRMQQQDISLPLLENIASDVLVKHAINQALIAATASGTITLTANPANTNTVTINGTVYTFKTSLGGSAFEILIGAANTDTASNLAAAINLADGSGTTYGSSTTRLGIITASASSNVVTLTAALRGTVGNGYTLAKSGANITISGATLSGGVDEPAGLFSYETGRNTFDIAGDKWVEGEENGTNGLSALEQIVKSEYGLFWQQLDGTLTFKNRDWILKAPATAASLTLSSEHDELESNQASGEIGNVVTVEFTPRSVLASGVVAESKNVITVPGQSGTERWNGTVVLPGGGSVVVKLPFTDPTTGKAMGAKSIVTPLVPTTDFTCGDSATDTSYTTRGYLTFSLAIKGSNVEVSIKNTALGPLYVNMLKVRGVGIVDYNATKIVQEDSTSQALYGKHQRRWALPMPSGQVFAESLAYYLLSKYKNPLYRVTGISFDNKVRVAGVNLFTVQLGTILSLTDYMTAITSQKLVVLGMAITLAPGDQSTIKLFVRALDDVTYWILGDSTYGVLGTTSRLGI